MATRLRTLILTGCLAMAGPCAALADETETSSGLYEELTGGSLAELPGLKNLGITLGGWISAGVTYNNHDPANHSNGTVTFNDRSSEFQLNQIYLYMERVVNRNRSNGTSADE